MAAFALGSRIGGAALPRVACTAFSCVLIAAGCASSDDERGAASTSASSGTRDCAVDLDRSGPDVSGEKRAILLACGQTGEGRSVAIYSSREAAGGPCLSIAGMPGGVRACGRAPSERVPPVRGDVSGPTIVQRTTNAPIELYGETGSDARRVTIRYLASDGVVRRKRATLLRAHGHEALEAAGIRRPFGYFVGSVPASADGIVATAHTRSGDVVGRAGYDALVGSMDPTVFIAQRQSGSPQGPPHVPGSDTSERIQTGVELVRPGRRVTLLRFPGLGRLDVRCSERPRVSFRVADEAATAMVGADTGRRHGTVRRVDPGQSLNTRLARSALQRWHVGSRHGDGDRVLTASVQVTPTVGGRGSCTFTAQSLRSGRIP